MVVSVGGDVVLVDVEVFPCLGAGLAAGDGGLLLGDEGGAEHDDAIVCGGQVEDFGEVADGAVGGDDG